MCRWPGYGFQAFECRTGYINQENNTSGSIDKVTIYLGNSIVFFNLYLELRIDTRIWINSNIERSVSGLLKACEGDLVPSPIVWLADAWQTV